jgi:tellurite resistance protein TerC
LDVSPWLYVGFIAFVIAMLLVDLKLFHTEAHTPTTKESGIWVAIWVSLAIVFGIGLLAFQGSRDAGEYFAGYLIEYSLSVDNMFVFVVIFSYFKIPLSHQHQILFYGILGAMVFRGIFIALGTALVQNFDWVIPIFGLFLLYTAFKIAKGSAEHVNPEDNPVLSFARKRFRTTTQLDGQKLFTVENGKRVATPLFIVLLFIETTDIFFAIDSIPAIFAVTKEPFIVLTSNVFAILGLRALYFLLAGGMDRLHLLKYGLAIILGFVGVKMLLEGTELVGLTEHAIHVPIWLSLTVIIGVLTATAVLSFKIPPKDQEAFEHRVSGDDDEANDAGRPL